MTGDDGFSGANRTSEVWLYSVCGAILVGLSGIFPLAVIPLESGAALKHGGKYNEIAFDERYTCVALCIGLFVQRVEFP